MFLLVLIGIPKSSQLEITSVNQNCAAKINVRDFSIENSQNETAAIQKVINTPGACSIYFPPGRYRITDTLEIPPNIREIISSEEEPRRAVIVQKTQDRPLFKIKESVNGLLISHLFFDGFGGEIAASGNAAILVIGPSGKKVAGITILDNHFQGFRQHPVTVYHGERIRVENNFFYRNAGGISFAGVTNGIIANNQIKDSNLAPGVFKVGIRLESKDCTVSGTPGYECDVSKNITISNNLVEDLWNSQCILVHSGISIDIQKNILRNCTLGVSANSYLPSDTIKDISIVENNFVGPRDTIVDAEEAGSAGISLGGGNRDPRNGSPTLFWIQGAKILRNEIRWANQDVSPHLGGIVSGGMMFIFTKDTLVQGNRVWWAGANSIAAQYQNLNLRIVGNDLISPVAIRGNLVERNGFRQSTEVGSYTLTGVFSRNRVHDIVVPVKLSGREAPNGFEILGDNSFTEIFNGLNGY